MVGSTDPSIKFAINTCLNKGINTGRERVLLYTFAEKEPIKIHMTFQCLAWLPERTTWDFLTGERVCVSRRKREKNRSDFL